jgi:hypothetical protein
VKTTERSTARNIVSENETEHNDFSLPEGSPLWAFWWEAIMLLRPAFSHTRTFMRFSIVVAGLTIHPDMLGVASIMRAFGFRSSCYYVLLKHFHSKGVRVDSLAELWATIVVPRLFGHMILRTKDGRPIYAGDGIKIPKCGRKMPGVKLVHQDSETKAKWAMAHSMQAVAQLVRVGDAVMAIPLAARIHEGVVLCNAHKETLLTKMLGLLAMVVKGAHVFVADAYYAAGPVIKGVLQRNGHLVTRMKSNAVAREPHVHEGPRKKGRPRKYGKKLLLSSLFQDRTLRTKITTSLYGEKDVVLQCVVRDLLWQPAGCLVRFVAVIHPQRGRCVLMSTDTSMDAEEIIRIYGLRFKIGVSRLTTRHSVGESPTEARDLSLVAREAPWNESETVKPSDSILRKEYMQHTRLQRTVNVDVASSNYPVAETLDYARRQQEASETSLTRRLSPAGYQRRHGVKGAVETGEARDARRRNLAEEARTITASGKCVRRRPGGGSDRSTDDGRAAKRARREGSGPLSDLSINVRHG